MAEGMTARDHEGNLRKNPDPKCVSCGGNGLVDSGGTTPWDSPIEIGCGCTYMSPQEAFVAGLRRAEEIAEAATGYRPREIADLIRAEREKVEKGNS